MSLINYFPKNYTPTTQQIYTLKQIESAFEQTDIVILCAPTGTGKSFVANTLGNSASDVPVDKKDSIISYRAFEVDQSGIYTNDQHDEHHGSLVLTISKALQDQYTSFFNCSTLKGKANYISTIDSTLDVEMESAVIPQAILQPHRKNHMCPYHNDRQSLLVDKFGVTNYSMFMSLPAHVKNRDYLICDEASELEDDLVSHNSCYIDYERLKRIGIRLPVLKTTEPVVVYNWLNDALQQLQDYRSYLQKDLQKKSKWSPKAQTSYSYINRTLLKLKPCTDNFYNCEYIVEKNLTMVSLTPVHVDVFAKQIFAHAKKTLLMSATIVDHKNFARSLGIHNYKYIEIGSEFPVDQSPIYVSGEYPICHNTIDKYLPKIVSKIKSILEHHKNEKGIIHTHTHRITQYVYESLNDDRLLYREPGKNNETIIQEHIDTEQPTVLVSPSLTHGIDLKDDLARFQIIVKLPYLPLHDKRVSRLAGETKDWYENKMLNNLVQACGRATRSCEDYSVTYILDGMITRVLPKCKDKLPSHYIKRFI